MPVRLSFNIDDEMAAALDTAASTLGRLAGVAGTNLNFSRDVAAATALRDWLIWAGYMPDDYMEEDTQARRKG
jgi:hypothetical protein